MCNMTFEETSGDNSSERFARASSSSLSSSSSSSFCAFCSVFYANFTPIFKTFRWKKNLQMLQRGRYFYFADVSSSLSCR